MQDASQRWSPLTDDELPSHASHPTFKLRVAKGGARSALVANESGQVVGGTPMERFKNNKISVTDLSAQLWCERQLDFTLSTGFRRETAAMRKGTARHELLEKEDHDTVDIEVDSQEDSLGFRLLNTFISLVHLLPKNGKVREVWICDVLDGQCVVRGVVDELALDQVAGCVVIKDTKTRSEPREPGAAQKRGTAMQLQTYRLMVDHLANNATDWLKVFQFFRCDPSAPFKHPILSKYGNLKVLARKVVKAFRSAPPFAPYTEVEYDCDGVVFKVDRIDYNPSVAAFSLAEAMGWWLGQREAEPVLHCERWKCRNCHFLDQCMQTPLAPAEKQATLEERAAQDAIQKDLEDLG